MTNDYFKRPGVAGVMEALAVLSIAGGVLLLVSSSLLAGITSVVFGFLYLASASIITHVAEIAFHARSVPILLAKLDKLGLSGSAIEARLSRPLRFVLSPDRRW